MMIGGPFQAPNSIQKIVVPSHLMYIVWRISSEKKIKNSRQYTQINKRNTQWDLTVFLSNKQVVLKNLLIHLSNCEIAYRKITTRSQTVDMYFSAQCARHTREMACIRERQVFEELP
jgi:hypothetical protein